MTLNLSYMQIINLTVACMCFFVSLLLKKRKKSHVAMTLHMLSSVELWQQVGKYVSFCGKYVKWKELSYRSKCKNIHSKWKNLYKYMSSVFLLYHCFELCR